MKIQISIGFGFDNGEEKRVMRECDNLVHYGRGAISLGGHGDLYDSDGESRRTRSLDTRAFFTGSQVQENMQAWATIYLSAMVNARNCDRELESCEASMDSCNNLNRLKQRQLEAGRTAAMDAMRSVQTLLRLFQSGLDSIDGDKGLADSIIEHAATVADTFQSGLFMHAAAEVRHMARSLR